MIGQDFGKRVGDDSPDAERALHETLLRLQSQGASSEEIAKAVLQSSFILALVWIVTAKRQLRASTGARPPFGWEDQLAKDPDLREDWRCETVRVLGERLRRKDSCKKEDDKSQCDLTRPSIGGYWRVKIIYTAIRAAWNLHEEGRLKVRRDKSSVVHCYGDGMSFLDDKKLDEGSADLAIDLVTAIGELKNPRQRAVMKLSLLGCTYQEIADRLTEENGLEGDKVTYEMVRGAFEKARAVLRMKLRAGLCR